MRAVKLFMLEGSAPDKPKFVKFLHNKKKKFNHIFSSVEKYIKRSFLIWEHLQIDNSSKFSIGTSDSGPRIILRQARITTPIMRRVVEASCQLLHCHHCQIIQRKQQMLCQMKKKKNMDSFLLSCINNNSREGLIFYKKSK